MCLGSPNDTYRNIDHMSYDLSTTCRRLGIPNTNLRLRFLAIVGYYFVDINGTIVPLEYVF